MAGLATVADPKTQAARDIYYGLPLFHQIEIFLAMRFMTTGDDLRWSFWLKSRHADVWLERRTTFTRGLAVMSIAGYIIGLGDRHPSNLMVDRVTGQVVHINFGDCFEVAQKRAEFSEKVPFRLTRHLIKAMEICGVVGNYSKSCEITMGVLRENDESLMAVFEAFVYDPLISWRLEVPNAPGGVDVEGGSAHAEASSPAADVNGSSLGGGGAAAQDSTILREAEDTEAQSPRALQVLDRVHRKLKGTEFEREGELAVEKQVAKLIGEATKVENLCGAFAGWCSYW
ncbi:hypothetical protein IAT38_003780 [Cryptococcus sp. DSM 104549]